MRHVTRLRALGAAGAASLLAVGISIAASGPASASGTPVRVALAGTQPGLATAKGLLKAAPALPAHITADVYLANRDTAGLTAFAQAVSTPGSAQYHHYLTAAQVKALYAPTTAEAQSVEGWATSNGLNVGAVTSGFGAYVQVTVWPAVVQDHPVPPAVPGVTPAGSVAVRVIGSFSFPPAAVTPELRVYVSVPPRGSCPWSESEMLVVSTGTGRSVVIAPFEISWKLVKEPVEPTQPKPSWNGIPVAGLTQPAG